MQGMERRILPTESAEPFSVYDVESAPGRESTEYCRFIPFINSDTGECSFRTMFSNRHCAYSGVLEIHSNPIVHVHSAAGLAGTARAGGEGNSDCYFSVHH